MLSFPSSINKVSLSHVHRRQLQAARARNQVELAQQRVREFAQESVRRAEEQAAVARAARERATRAMRHHEVQRTGAGAGADWEGEEEGAGQQPVEQRAMPSVSAPASALVAAPGDVCAGAAAEDATNLAAGAAS